MPKTKRANYNSLMRRLLLPLLFLLISCRTIFPVPQPPQATPTPNMEGLQKAALTASSPPPALSPTKTPALEFLSPPDTYDAPTSILAPLADIDFTVRMHPDGSLYTGDLVSVEVIAPENIDLAGRNVLVRVQTSQGIRTANADFAPYGIAGRSQATLYWVWDTSGLGVGEHNISFSLQPDGINWTETVSLGASSDIPSPEPEADWAMEEIDCCIVYYITGTEAERDLDDLLEMVDAQMQKANQNFDMEFDEPVTITFLPRVLGHGGFAGKDVAVSYLDRNYAGKITEIVLHHEMVHILDSKLGGELRPTILIEGLAVYLSGGHFKPEPLIPRAAALLAPKPGCEGAPLRTSIADVHHWNETCGLDWYIPLPLLTDNFYFEQHEIGYLQAGALVEFMVETWGWEAFSQFYRDIHPAPESTGEFQDQLGPQGLAMDAALQDHFGLALQELEERFLDALRQEKLTSDLVDDIRLTVKFYETMRRYQQYLDHSAYFLTAWVPDRKQMRQRGIVAEYLRHPSQPENLVLERRLVVAGAALRSGEYRTVEHLLAEVNALLDRYAYGQ